MQNAVSGQIELRIDGQVEYAAGSFTYNLGANKREAKVGHDQVHGYKSMPQVPFIEGEITDRGDLDVSRLINLDGINVTLSLSNGKTILLQGAWYAGDGDIGTEEGNIQARFEGRNAVEI